MLTSTHVVLTPVAEADLPLLFEWINDREQVLWNGAYRPVSAIQHRRWFEEIQDSKDRFVFAIRRRDPEKLIGVCQLHSVNWVHRSAELQIRIGDVTERGRGYGTEAVRRLLDFGFVDLNLQRIALHVLADNAAAVKTYEKAGFVREGVLCRAAYVDGAYRDLVVMASLRP